MSYIEKNRIQGVHQKAKIIATVGPTSREKKILIELIKAGADVFRLNFSHGTHQDHQKTIDVVREINAELGTHIALLQDLQGPKIRIGTFKKNNAVLKNNQKFTLDLNSSAGDEKRVFLPHKEIFQSVKTNTRILVDDGKIILNITKVSSDKIETDVINGGKISNMKGVNILN